MIWAVTHLVSFAIGAIVAGAYARGQIVKIKRDDLSFRIAPTIPHSLEDVARRAGC
ncbi:hypothetical protein [Mesorhizobium sp. M0859]|uniref:hypothetical protein n=1 Tax=Mesorhizobium sp. M0859 TaxID=2957014 RepID=UPI0033372E7F